MLHVGPGRGWVAAVGGASVNRFYSVLGPFAKGDWLRRVTFTLNADAAGGMTFGASIGAVGEETAACYGAGSPVVHRGVVAFNGVPEVGVTLAAGVGLSVVVPIGVVAHEGARYLVSSCAVLAPIAAGQLITAVEVLTYRRSPPELQSSAEVQAAG